MCSTTHKTREYVRQVNGEWNVRVFVDGNYSVNVKKVVEKLRRYTHKKW